MINNDIIALISLAVYVLLDAIAQGKLGLLTRAYVPPTAQADVNLPLHKLYPACYGVLALVLAYWAGWHVLLVAVALRLALLDPVLNATKSDPLFAVGSSAATDKLLRKWAPNHPERLSAIIRLAAALFLAAAAVAFATH
jgi:hypothetical protein